MELLFLKMLKRPFWERGGSITCSAMTVLNRDAYKHPSGDSEKEIIFMRLYLEERSGLEI